MQEKSQLIIILVIAFTAVFSVMGVFFIVFFRKYNQNLIQRQKEAIHNLFLGQQNERERIARDLHDGINAEIGSIIRELDEIEKNKPANEEIIAKVKLKLKSTAESIRQISQDLMPVSLKKYGLVYTIEQMIEQDVLKECPIYFKCNTNKLNINEETEFHLYKITQELIHNTLKHSKASEMILDIYYYPEKKKLEYNFSDDGRGMEQTVKTNGIGLKNIATRAALMNGLLTINGKDGFRLTLQINL